MQQPCHYKDIQPEALSEPLTAVKTDNNDSHLAPSRQISRGETDGRRDFQICQLYWRRNGRLYMTREGWRHAVSSSPRHDNNNNNNNQHHV